MVKFLKKMYNEGTKTSKELSFISNIVDQGLDNI